MFKLILFYCACQLVIQSFLYLGFRGMMKKSIYRFAYTMNWSNKQILKAYNIAGLVINTIITAIAILVTARASMVGTANLLASTILTIFIYLDSLLIVYEYKSYKESKDKLALENKKPSRLSLLKTQIDDLNKPVEIPAYLFKQEAVYEKHSK